MSDFAPQVVRQLKTIDDRLARLESYPVGPALAELPGDFLDLPGLRGLWLPGSADNTGAMYDRSGQGRTLTYNGNPTLNLHNSTVPYWDYDGTGDFHSRADEAGLDVLGNEAVIAAAIRGLTFGGWIWTDTTAAFAGVMEKGNAYLLAFTASANPQFQIQDNLGAFPTLTAGVTVTTGAWHFLVGRFRPAVALDIYFDGTLYTQAAATSATIANTAAQLAIAARFTPGNYLDGRCALAFLCAAALPDDLLNYLFMRTRPLFSV